jgi:hypothetical protein
MTARIDPRGSKSSTEAQDNTKRNALATPRLLICTVILFEADGQYLGAWISFQETDFASNAERSSAMHH